MPIQKQLSVFMPNRPGVLAKACAVLSENGINIMALAVHDTVDNAVVRFLVDHPTKALLLLEQEALYVLEDLDDPEKAKRCTVFIDGRAHRVQAQTGIYLRPGQTLMVDNPGPEAVCFVSSQCPEGESGIVPLGSVDLITDTQAPEPSLVRLADQREMPAGDRWYRVLVDHEIGSEQVTQFVGSIPPGRAPDHFHEYEEVLFILRGTGRMWTGDLNTPIGPGSCVYLPKGQVHCIENTGPGVMRILGVFHPSGDPASRAYEDNSELIPAS